MYVFIITLVFSFFSVIYAADEKRIEVEDNDKSTILFSETEPIPLKLSSDQLMIEEEKVKGLCVEKSSENIPILDEIKSDLIEKEKLKECELGSISVYEIEQKYIYNILINHNKKVESIENTLFFVTLNCNAEFLLGVSLIPWEIHTGWSGEKVTGKIIEIPESLIKVSNLIKTWEIQIKYIKDAVRRTKKDIKLLEGNQINVKYDNYKIVSSGGDLVYGNKSYAQYVLGFANICKEEESYRNEFDVYSFNENFSYMYGETPTTMFTDVIGFSK